MSDSSMFSVSEKSESVRKKRETTRKRHKSSQTSKSNNGSSISSSSNKIKHKSSGEDTLLPLDQPMSQPRRGNKRYANPKSSRSRSLDPEKEFSTNLKKPRQQMKDETTINIIRVGITPRLKRERSFSNPESISELEVLALQTVVNQNNHNNNNSTNNNNNNKNSNNMTTTTTTTTKKSQPVAPLRLPSPDYALSMTNDCNFMGMSRKELANLLDKYHIRKQTLQDLPSPPCTTSTTTSTSTTTTTSSKSDKEPSRLRVSKKKVTTSFAGEVKGPSAVMLHAYWSTKHHLTPAGSLLKEIVPLENFHLHQKWIVYILVKEARCAQDGSIVPFMNATVSFNNGIAHTTPMLVSWEPAWNQTFYFAVQDIQTDSINVAVHLTRNRGKDTKEGVCVGKCDLRLKTFHVLHGYYAPWDKWEVLLDPNTGQSTESFARLIVQLLPSNVEAFGNLENETIRILPESANYKEQFGAHLSKNRLPSKKI